MKRNITLLIAIIMMMGFVVSCTPKTDGSNNVDVNIDDIHEKIKSEFGEDYFPNMNVDLEELKAMTGLNFNENHIKDFIAEIPLMSINVDTFIAIEAEEGKGDVIETVLNDHRQNTVDNSIQYPINQAKVNASKVVRHGDYVFFLMFGKFDDRENLTEDEALEFAEKEIKKAEDIISSFFNKIL